MDPWENGGPHTIRIKDPASDVFTTLVKVAPNLYTILGYDNIIIKVRNGPTGISLEVSDYVRV